MTHRYISDIESRGAVSFYTYMYFHMCKKTSNLIITRISNVNVK